MKKPKIFKSKHAVNDISIITGIISVFVLLGVIMPYINSEFSGSSSSVNATTFKDDLGNTIDNTNTINAFTIILSVLKMFFWTFGSLPFWLDAIFIIFRIILALTIARNVWIGGGG